MGRTWGFALMGGNFYHEVEKVEEGKIVFSTFVRRWWVFKGAYEMRQMALGVPLEQIAQGTGLTESQIRELS
jgi:hypothetical protein